MSDYEKQTGEKLAESFSKLESAELKDKALTFIEGMAAAAECLKRQDKGEE